MTIYRDRSDYVVPSCPYCGSPPKVNWVDIELHGSRMGSVVTGLTCLARDISWDPGPSLADVFGAGS